MAKKKDKVNVQDVNVGLKDIASSYDYNMLDKVIDLVNLLSTVKDYDIEEIQWNLILIRAMEVEKWDVIEKVISFLKEKVVKKGKAGISFNGTFLIGPLRNMNRVSDIKRFFLLMGDRFDFKGNIVQIAHLIRYIIEQKNEDMDVDTKDLMMFFKEMDVFCYLESAFENWDSDAREGKFSFFDGVAEEKFRYLVVDCDLYGDCLGGDDNKKVELVVDAIMNKEYDKVGILLDMPGLDLDKVRVVVEKKRNLINKSLDNLVKEKEYDKLEVFFKLPGIVEEDKERLKKFLGKKVNKSYMKKLISSGECYKLGKIFGIPGINEVEIRKYIKRDKKDEMVECVKELIDKSRYDDLEKTYTLDLIEEKEIKMIVKEKEDEIKKYIKKVMDESGCYRKLKKIYNLPFIEETDVMNGLKEYVEEVIDNIDDVKNININNIYYNKLRRVFGISFVDTEWMKSIINERKEIEKDVEEKLKECLEEWESVLKETIDMSNHVDIKSRYVDAIENGGNVIDIFDEFGIAGNPSKEDGVNILLLAISDYMQKNDEGKIDRCFKILQKEIDNLDTQEDWNNIVNDIVLLKNADILKNFLEIVKYRKDIKKLNIKWDEILQSVVYYVEDVNCRMDMLDILMKDCKNVFRIDWEKELVDINEENKFVVAYVVDTCSEKINICKLLIKAIYKGDKDLIKNIMDECKMDECERVGKACDILKEVLQHASERVDIFGYLVTRYGNDDIRDELFSALYKDGHKISSAKEAKWVDFLKRDVEIRSKLQEYFLDDVSRLMYICKDTVALEKLETKYNLYGRNLNTGDLLFEAAKKEDLDLIKHLLKKVNVKSADGRWLKQIELSTDIDLYDDVIEYVVKENIELLLDVEEYSKISRHIEENIGVEGLKNIKCKGVDSIGGIMAVVLKGRGNTGIGISQSKMTLGF